MQTLRGHPAHYGVAFSSDDGFLASADGSNVVLWSRNEDGSYAEAATLIGPEHISSLAISPDGDFVAASGASLVSVWRVADGALIHSLPETTYVQSVAFSPGGRLLASCGYSREVKLWDVESGELVQPLNANNVNWLPRLAFSPDGQRLIHVVYAREIKVWDRQPDGTFAFIGNTNAHTGTAFAVAFSPDGNLFASGAAVYGGFSDTGELKLWSAADGTLLQALTGHTRGVYGVDFSPDGLSVTSASWDRTVKVWSRASDTEPFQLWQTLTGHTDQVNTAKFSGSDVLATASKDTTVRIWQRRADGTFQQIQILDRSSGGHTAEVEPLAFSADGVLLISGGHDDLVKVWEREAENQFVLRQTLEDESEIESLALSPNSQDLIAGNEEGGIRQWAQASDGTYQWVRDVDAHQDKVHGLAFAPDGQTFVSVSADRTIRFWSTGQGENLVTYDRETGLGVQSVAFRPDGAYFGYSRTDATIGVARSPS